MGRVEAGSAVIWARNNEPRSSVATAASAIGESDAVSPSNIPVAILASAMAEHVEPASRSRFAPLLRTTLASLRTGRWWLSLEQRRRCFYDGELRRWLTDAQPAAPTVRADTRLATCSPNWQAASAIQSPMGNTCGRAHE